MTRFIKNVLYGLVHFYSPAGRDSRQTYCDIYRGLIVLGLAGICFCVWRNTLAVMFVRQWLVISEGACWALTILFELWLLVAYAAAAVRRWQDLDIRIPPEESVRSLITRSRFYEVLAHEEGSRERNQYGEAPKENPVPLVSEKDLKEAVRKKLFADTDFERIK